MDSVNAERYMFNAMSGSSMIEVEAFQHMLVQCGASVVNATREWVANHYRWIVWKLACLERGYATQAGGKFLNVSNVLEELKYRYEREINLGHRSAIKKILEGNASPASMLVLCISAIRSSPTANHETEQSVEMCEDHQNMARRGTHSHVAIIELTDGWYLLNTLLDVELSKQLCSGKLFVGQKLRIWGAGLAGWVGPVSPLEASESVKLTIHINGTYRASWDDRLGFCKSPSVPLAFWCIKGYGGQVPRTLVGVERIYPILYKERFSDGSSVVRTRRMENEVLHLHNQRRSDIIEGIMAEQQKENFGLHCQSNSDSEEGAKLFKILEKAAEPEVLMADMSSEQLNSFATYQAKQEEIRQADMQKKIERALEDACLSTRQVIPFMKVKVVGLTSLCSRRKGHLREGLITIWDPTEKLKGDLVEGQAYSVAGLVPSNSNPDIIYLQARGSATVWKPLSPVALKNFEPFFTRRKAVLLSSLGEVPLASEFDIAAVVVYVGEVYISGNQKKQWVFVTDGSAWGSDFSEEFYNSLLAISFCLSNVDNYASAPVSHSLSGCIVGFSNLVKRARDQMNHLWVAEATENSTHTTCHNLSVNSHLKEAADIARKWAKDSVPSIQKLRERVLTIVGSSGS
ncbi:hypothetical protein QJS04_geneDACA005966 [Acorus gramineus]|uniref:Tower domain-containing protein n=1 Tax=Acorus gramineus TaxID=55184 RepID=A0AAV9B7M2_ACOGR|nr:hypothetical protein QJS04_geneDACA005966 [Acorus gramineus]